MKNKILVVAAHPDDEVLGCGASIAKWTKQGHIVNILILSQGLLSRDNLKNTNVKLNKLKLDAVKSSKILGVKRINFCDFPDNKMDSIGLLNIVKSIEKYVFKFKPNILVTHSNADLNIDHKITHQACITATRTQNNNPVKKILAFEIPSSTEWNFILDYKKFYPNYFENVSGFIKKK